MNDEKTLKVSKDVVPKGWLLAAITEDNQIRWIPLLVNNIAHGNRAIKVIPIFTDPQDAQLGAAKAFDGNPDIKDLMIVDAKSLLTNKPIIQFITKKVNELQIKLNKPWWRFW